MQPLDELPYTYHKETLTEHAQTLLKQSPWSKYAPRLEAAAKELKGSGCNDLNYELHMPMLFNKAKALKAFTDKYDQFHICLKDGDFETTISNQTTTSPSGVKADDFVDVFAKFFNLLHF